LQDITRANKVSILNNAVTFYRILEVFRQKAIAGIVTNYWK